MAELLRQRRPDLRSFTSARVSLATAGHSIATSEVLDFQLAHARARDAVHAHLHLDRFAARLRSELPILREVPGSILELQTNAGDRATYLRRPDLGRTLDAGSAARVQRAGGELAIVVADGLSALAVERNTIPLLSHLLPHVLAAGWTICPLTLVEQGRVAIGDPIGLLLGASISLVLIGERPGLSSHDSLGAYITWHPHPSRTDADRNCLSNIREGGLSAESAAARLFWYLETARARQLTGTLLKEGSMELRAGEASGRELEG